MTDWVNPYDREQYEEICRITALDCTGDPGLTMQAPAEEQDINIIMKRFGVKDGSVLPRWESPEQMYGDFTQLPDGPVEAQEYIRQGELRFMTLPAEVRRIFGDGAHLYEWLQDTTNHEKAAEMGILERVVSSNTSSVKEPPLVTISTGDENATA